MSPRDHFIHHSVWLSVSCFSFSSGELDPFSSGKRNQWFIGLANNKDVFCMNSLKEPGCLSLLMITPILSRLLAVTQVTTYRFPVKSVTLPVSKSTWMVSFTLLREWIAVAMSITGCLRRDSPCVLKDPSLFAQLVLGLQRCNTVESKTIFGVIEETEILFSLVNAEIPVKPCG